MCTEIYNFFLAFLNKYLPERPPLLLGLSGGPDSMTLFHLLIKNDYPFHVAHIDHGWRKESREESHSLRSLCEKNKITFYLEQLEVPKSKKNLEDQGRNARIAFFKKIISQESSLQGVLLAHHADDHAETVLKRVFEGASLPKLKGLLPVTDIEGIKVYRPFLKLHKKSLLTWLSENKISFFFDTSNEDLHFLRARLRKDLIPFIAHKFGKEIAANLCRLGEAAAELENFLHELMMPYLANILVNAETTSIDFSCHSPTSNFLWKAVVRTFFEKQRISLTSPLLESIVMHLQRESCHKQMKIGTHTLSIHKKKLTIK